VLLAVRHASKSYNGVPALTDASLELRAGEVHALMGENGAGKSTLIKLLAGVLAPDRIEVEIQGRPATLHSPQAAYGHGLRFIHQELNIVPQLSVAENVFLGQRYPAWFGTLVRWRTLNRRARDVLAMLGVHHIDPSERMARLSPGDQMLVSIARAFAGDDSDNGSRALVYVMDEPTAALTGHEVDLLFEVINGLKARGSAVLYVSHRMEEIFRISDRITVMRDGRVVGTRHAADTHPGELIRLMTGRTLQQVYPPRQTPVGERMRLTVRNLRSHAVRADAFDLREGEIVGVAGLNGSGRTELLRALVGADRRLSGEILLDGRRVSLTPAMAWRNGVAFVPEERRSQGLVLSRSVADNITLPGLAWLSRGGMLIDRGLERRTSRSLGDTVQLKMIGPDQTVRELSGGNQQKAVFARALTRTTRVLLLLDEPTRGVDVGAKVDLYRLIRELSGQGAAILMVSSDLPELIGMTDRILIMRQGVLVDEVPTAGLTEESLLSLCYGETAHERSTDGGR